MGMVWQMAALSGNERWKGLTWGMLPLHASGVAACTYHFFYNSPDLSFLVLLQAALTLAGNTTCAVAAARLASSNGWMPSMLNPFDQSSAAASPSAAASDPPAAAAISGAAAAPNAAKLVVLTALASYGVKYGELLLGPVPYLSGVEGAVAGVLLCFGFPALTAARFRKLSAQEAKRAPREPRDPAEIEIEVRGARSCLRRLPPQRRTPPAASHRACCPTHSSGQHVALVHQATPSGGVPSPSA